MLCHLWPCTTRARAREIGLLPLTITATMASKPPDSDLTPPVTKKRKSKHKDSWLEEAHFGEKIASSGAGGSGEKFTFFFGKDSPFSQWHPARFEVDGVTYNCAEQYMMHQKAVLFGDEAMATKILKSDDPKEQKALGRKVSNFDQDKWKEECRKIVKAGNLAKVGIKTKYLSRSNLIRLRVTCSLPTMPTHGYFP